MKMKLKAVLLLVALALAIGEANAVIYYGEVIDTSNPANVWQCGTCINLFGEPGATVTIKYINVNATPVQATTTTDWLGIWLFNISDHVPFSNYSLVAAKGVRQSPTAMWNFSGAGESAPQYKGALTISDDPVVIRIVPSVPIVNKGDSVYINITVEPNGNLISGMAVFPEYDRRMQIQNVTEGNLLNKAFSTIWQNKSSSSPVTFGRHVIFGVTLGMSSQSTTNGTFASLVMIAVNNGTANFTLNSSTGGIISPLASWTRAVVYPGIIKITMPCDINGDYACSFIDLSIVTKFMNKTGPNLCPEYYGRCNVDGYRDPVTGNVTVNQTDKEQVTANYGKKVNTTLPS